MKELEYNVYYRERGNKEGQEFNCTITCSNKSGISDTLTVYVTNIVHRIYGNPDRIDVVINQSYSFSGVLVEPSTITPSYSIQNTNIATVSVDSGVVTVNGINVGTTNLVITAGNAQVRFFIGMAVMGPLIAVHKGVGFSRGCSKMHRPHKAKKISV